MSEATINPAVSDEPKPTLLASDPVEKGLELVQLGVWTIADYAAWDDSRKRTLVIAADNMSADTFATLTKLDHKGDEDRRDLLIEKSKVQLKPMRFSTGSVGYNMTGKVILQVGGKSARFQMTGNMILIGSKPGDE